MRESEEPTRIDVSQPDRSRRLSTAIREPDRATGVSRLRIVRTRAGVGAAGSARRPGRSGARDPDPHRSLARVPTVPSSAMAAECRLEPGGADHDLAIAGSSSSTENGASSVRVTDPARWTGSPTPCPRRQKRGFDMVHDYRFETFDTAKLVQHGTSKRRTDLPSQSGSTRARRIPRSAA